MVTAGVFAFLVAAVVAAQPADVPTTCQVTGRITGAGTALPGVSVVVTAGDGTRRGTSTDIDGIYLLSVPIGSYVLLAELSGFQRVERAIVFTLLECERVVDVVLTLIPARQPMTIPATTTTRTTASPNSSMTVLDATTTASVAAVGSPVADAFGFDVSAAAIVIAGSAAAVDHGVLSRHEKTGSGISRRRNRTRSTLDYTFGGSALDQNPYRLRDDVRYEETPYTQQSLGFTASGPMTVPTLYGNRSDRTTFVASYTGTRGGTLFDQYGTVLTEAQRGGDLSSMRGAAVLDPLTGDPFIGNRIPEERMSGQARALMSFIPAPNLPGATKNYHYVTTRTSATDAMSLRLTHTFFASAGARPKVGSTPGQLGGLTRPTNVVLTVHPQYQRTYGQRTNLFETLGGETVTKTLTLPASISVVYRGHVHSINFQTSGASSATRNRFGNVVNVTERAGIRGTSMDAFAWGVPSLAFSSISGLRDVTPSHQHDRRTRVDYTWAYPVGRRHSIRMGFNVEGGRVRSRTESNANGAFVFSGLYTSGGARELGGFDVADFLLGLPQHASVQYGPGEVTNRGRSLALYAQDDWRARGSLTLAWGLRYEVLWPFVETDGRAVNLDVAPAFSAAVPVMAGEVGPFSGRFPRGLLLTDTNNVAPRIGVAWRYGGAVIRVGYGISYNSGAYAGFARQFSTQPPFAISNTAIGSLTSILRMQDAFTTVSPTQTTNTFGVDRTYQLGQVQTWNADIQRAVGRLWTLSANYLHTRGSSLDVVRAPNRGPAGLRIEGIQPFLWQTSEGASVLHSIRVQLQRQYTGGIGGKIAYTIARSRDNAPSIGGGTLVAQDDQNLDAEWGLSNFDRRHRVAADLSLDLPFGPNRRWLRNGGFSAELLRNWSLTATFGGESGMPLTPRVSAATRDVAQGLNGALRADYNGQDIDLEHSTTNRFFNTSAFSVPNSERFGNAPRNVITGPGFRQLDAQVSRDVTLGGQRTLTVRLRVTNLLGLVNYLTVDTFVNSPTFGQVESVRPMRSAQVNLRFAF